MVHKQEEIVSLIPSANYIFNPASQKQLENYFTERQQQIILWMGHNATAIAQLASFRIYHSLGIFFYTHQWKPHIFTPISIISTGNRKKCPPPPPE